MIRREVLAPPPTQTPSTTQEIAPGIFWQPAQSETEEALVEITLPPVDMERIVARCQEGFDDFALEVCQDAVGEIEGPLNASAFGRELAAGLFNMRVLGAVLEERLPREVGFTHPLVYEAFRLASRGRLKMTEAANQK